MSELSREAELLTHSQQGVDSSTQLPSSFLLLGDKDARMLLLCSLLLPPLHRSAISPSFPNLAITPPC